MKGLRPFFSYFGAKWRLALKYPAPLHDRVIEPFAGSAGYSLRHYQKDVVLVEACTDLCEMWEFLIKAKRRDIERLPLIRLDQTVDDLDLPCRGAEVLIGFWLIRGSTAPSKAPNNWMRKHKDSHPGSFWGERARARIADQVEAINHWHVVRGSYEDVKNETATWFIDPPYQVAGKSYVHGSGSVEFQHLGKWCRSRHGQVIVCENEGATWMPFRPFEKTKGTRRQSREVIWTK